MPPSPETAPAGVRSFGKLQSAVALLPPTAGSRDLKLTRGVTEDTDYAEPPGEVGQGIKGWVWVKDPGAAQKVYTLKAPRADLEAAVPLAEWRDRVRADFPNGVVANRRSPAARRLAEFARRLLSLTADLHRNNWRLGLVDTDNVYLVEDAAANTTAVFLPDLGFAWLGRIVTTAPNWLAGGTELWGEKRVTRQCAAPKHRESHPAGAEWPELVQRDLRVAARLLKFVLTGDVRKDAPPDAGGCPVWKVIRKAEGGGYTDTDAGLAAENMLAELLAGLRAPPEPGPAPQKTGGSATAVLVSLVLLLAAGAAGWWFFFLREHEQVASTGTPGPGTGPDRPGPGPPPKHKPPEPRVEPGTAADKVRKAPNLLEKGKAAVELSKSDPKHELVARTRAELWAAYKEAYRQAHLGEHLPLRSQELLALFNQLPETP
jgi:hypothetical protein